MLSVPHSVPLVHQLFISYSPKDRAFVERLSQALVGAGRATWVDWRNIPPSCLHRHSATSVASSRRRGEPSDVGGERKSASDYVNRYTEAAQQLVRDGYLIDRDARAMIEKIAEKV